MQQLPQLLMGSQYALMISGKCGYHLMELPTFRAGSVFSGRAARNEAILRAPTVPQYWFALDGRQM